jgi:hypothetical protein
MFAFVCLYEDMFGLYAKVCKSLQEKSGMPESSVYRRERSVKLKFLWKLRVITLTNDMVGNVLTL